VWKHWETTTPTKRLHSFVRIQQIANFRRKSAVLTGNLSLELGADLVHEGAELLERRPGDAVRVKEGRFHIFDAPLLLERGILCRVVLRSGSWGGGGLGFSSGGLGLGGRRGHGDRLSKLHVAGAVRLREGHRVVHVQRFGCLGALETKQI